MRRVFGWMLVVVLCCAASGEADKREPDARLAEAQAALDEAAELQRSGDYSSALARVQHASALREAVLGRTHPEVASCLNQLGNLYRLQGDLAHAKPLLQRALSLREAALGKSHPHVAASLQSLAILYTDQGLYGQAEPLFQRALAIREAAFGKNHPDVANSLDALAVIALKQGLYDRAEPLYQRALAIREALGPHHPDVATSLNNLAALFLEQGLYGRAEPLFQRALSLWEKERGPHHPYVSMTLNNLAALFLEQGLYDRAEPLFQRALSNWEEVLGPDHPHVAMALNNLAKLYDLQGLYDRSEPLHQRALAISETALGEAHPQVATLLTNFAIFYQSQELYGRAEPLLQRALALQEEALGKSHPDVAQTLQHLASLYSDQGLYERAKPLLQRALTLREAALGKNHPKTATSRNNLAVFFFEQELYGQAEPLYRRALTTREATLGKSHPDVAASLNNFALLRLAQHRLSDALPLFTRAFSLSEQRLRQEALDFSESRLTAFLQYLRANEQTLYTLLRMHPEDPRVQRLALGAVLLRKGRSIEEAANISLTLAQSLSPEDRDAFERLRELRTQLATLSLKGPGSLSPGDYPQRLQSLTDAGDALEAGLARRSAPFRVLTALPSPADIVDRVAASLPQDGALVEFITYTDKPLIPQNGTPSEQLPSQLRYLALVLFPDASTRAVDLGPAAPIDRDASRLRDALANRDTSFQVTAQALYQSAFQPLLPLLGSTRRILLSPDGQLSLIPFAALHDGHGFLLDSFDFLYLTSGRQLLPHPEELAPSSSVVVLADPDFTAPPSGASLLSTRAVSSSAIERFLSTARADLPSSTWVPLPGTRQEAESIQRLLSQAQLFLGPEASKERLFKLPTPGILHLATHGFFIDDAPVPPGSRAVVHFGALGELPQPPSLQAPLLRSGLALAGARALESDGASAPSPHRPDAALVTALELAGLNLWGTQLVVLSACDTGRGQVQLGQGVQGLRRSLVVAGAETIVMSLWKVNDDSTRLLMDAYYRNLLAGQGRAFALHEAMRSLRASRPHPHDWAPFIALGSDAPLRSIAPTSPRTAQP
ncbi:CHAT domain-containing tetratricopeptide repeat protein [Stigmatella aurantiaca]|uniref:Tetratricopeptide repeat family n=1 Tax=Stigmatella aurantiaca (strain DW4/3-1) TaxID=378806 RepID=Q08RD1_STIAD|nr:CHAT domain-containing protein [Stigmatella aurantiaca]ADO68069.1 Tetratricopeptide repeat family protein [Stigmatella aurantiaca DW4/3-1]EAU63036.1 tetratricopeptide repeat family [Stigmatella aurantiaca DW4/3-1]